jgi:hypothetical protein
MEINIKKHLHLSQLFTLKPAREVIKNMVKHKMKNVLNCSNRL